MLAALFAQRLNARGFKDGNILAGMLAGSLALPCIILIQFMPTATWAYVLYVPAMMLVNAPFGLANGSLPVIAPHIRIGFIFKTSRP